MEVIIRPDADQAAALTARLIAQEVRLRPNAVLGLATGRTMERVYNHLVRLHQTEGLSFRECRTFNLDEYIGLPPEHSGSFAYYMRRHFFSRVDLRPENAHLPNGLAADLPAECARYEALIRQSGGVDLQLLGIGPDGHIGFNEPLSALRSRTREKALTSSTRQANADAFGGDFQQVPCRAITMGVGTILEAKRCILLATGERKAAIVAQAVEGPITAMVSASALQLHPRCVVIVDEAAAAGLDGADYYRWLFEHEPEWEAFR